MICFPGKDGTNAPPDRSKSPHLFSVFLDPSKSVKASGSVSFAFDLKVLVPDYEVDGVLFMKRHYEGGFIFRELILVEAFPDQTALGGWRIKYGYQDNNPGKPGVECGNHGRSTDGRLWAATGLTFRHPDRAKGQARTEGEAADRGAELERPRGRPDSLKTLPWVISTVADYRHQSEGRKMAQPELAGEHWAEPRRPVHLL